MPAATSETNTYLDSRFGSGSPATWYVGLLTGIPVSADGSGYTEPGGTAYARQAVTNNATNFPAASAGVQSLDAATSWPAADIQWNVVGIGLFSAASGGNCLYWQTYTKTVPIGAVLSIASGSITVS